MEPIAGLDHQGRRRGPVDPWRIIGILAAPLRVGGEQRDDRPGTGNGPIDAFIAGLRNDLGVELVVRDYHEHATTAGANSSAVAYVELEVGGKSVRAVEGCTIAGKTITLDLLTYGPKDGSCCPSVPRKVRYTFEKGVLSPLPEPAPSAS